VFNSNEIIIISIFWLNKGNIVAKAFDGDVGIIDMHIEDMFLAISGKYLDILSSLVTLTLQILT
jgi:hypothetical protein